MNVTPGGIRPLPPELVERIAAGEVIERPASVVRELVENSLDAGAGRVEIMIEEGGIRLIRVRDDGCGILREDLSRALEAHATSKIASYEDLAHLSTLGFRGEALASMAAVADVAIISRASGRAEAYRLDAVRPGHPSAEPRAVAHPTGTTVEVRDLFYRFPARRRFLRTPVTESRHVLEAVRRLAFAHPETSFEVRDETRILLAVPAVEGKEAETVHRWLESLAGRRFADGALRVKATSGDLDLDGWLLDPRCAGELSEPQLWCINGRPLRDRTLHHALRRSCEEFLHGRAQPAYLLRLTLLPGDVDMNVHPAKQEIRFRDGGRLHAFVEGACHERLAAPHGGEATLLSPRHDIPAPPSAGRAPFGTGRGADLPGLGAPRPPVTKIALRMDETLARASQEFQPAAEDTVFAAGTGRRCLGEPLAVLAGTFLVARSDDDLVVVDIHAAHERLLFEDLKAQYEQGPVPRQRLLVPHPVDLGPRVCALLAEAAPRLERLGFEIDALGPSTLVIRAVPLLLGRSDPQRLLEAVASRWDDEPDERALAERVFEILADVACDQAVKAGGTMGIDAMKELLHRLEEAEGAEHCSHGRPSYVVLGRETFDRFFRRGR